MSYISPRHQGRTIFLTGGSGVVGQALLARLAPSPVICLVRRTSLKAPWATRIAGDISLPRFGLTQTQLRNLAKRIDCIVHAAAVTEFAGDDELTFRTNVQSLENIFELAALADVPLYHLSTAFVRPCAQSGSPVGDVPYVISKREGERLVRESGLPYVIIRPSIVIGDSSSGVIARFQAFHNVVSSFLNGFLPMMPASPEAFLDFIPQDALAEVIVALINENRTGAEYWITSGAGSLTIRRIGSIAKEFARARRHTLELPRFMPPDTIDRLIRPAFMSALSPAIRKRCERLLQVSAYLCISEPFTTSLPELQQRLKLPPLPDLEAAFVQSLNYWAETTSYFRRVAV